MVSDQIQTSYLRGKSEFYHQNHPHHYQACLFPVGGEGPGKESEEVVERLPLIKVMLLISFLVPFVNSIALSLLMNLLLLSDLILLLLQKRPMTTIPII